VSAQSLSRRSWPWRPWWRSLLAGLVCVLGLQSLPAQAAAPDLLRAQFDALRAKAQGQLGDKPVYLQSSEVADHMQGDVYALIDQPYANLRQGLARAEPWCGVLILHLNVKYCRAVTGSAGQDELVAGVGRKFDQPLSSVYWVRFGFSLASASDSYFNAVLQAPSGPLSTRDYRIVLEAVPLSAGQTLLHMSYAYGYGTAARWAMQAYLATIGSDKRGFSVVGQGADGRPQLVAGVRGVLERNTLRYYLAIDAWLSARAQSETELLPRSLQLWFSATERFAQQLHEIEREAYVEMKLREARRQQSVEPPAAK